MEPSFQKIGEQSVKINFCGRGCFMSPIKHKLDLTEVDWKKRVMDSVFIRNNIKQGRCVVKTLSTTELRAYRTTLHPDNSSVYKDLHLVNWQTSEIDGSYSDVRRFKSHIIDMVREEYIEVDDKEIAFVGNYIAKSPSSYFGGMSFNGIQVHEFDEEKSRQGQVFDKSKAIKLPIPEGIYNGLITNYCDHSKYIGFTYRPDTQSFAYILDGTTGAIVFQTVIPDSNPSDRYLGLYDTYLAVRPWQVPNERESKLFLMNIVTRKKITKLFKEHYELCLMREDEIVFRCGDKFIIWNYKNDTEKEYPVGQVGSLPVKMIYNNMWLAIESYNAGMVLSFYDMKDGAKVGSVSFKNRTTMGNGFSQLSDGRLAVCLASGCHVISFMNSEVTRMIKVLLMDIKGNVKEHEIMAYQLVDFFLKSTEGSLPEMTSRVVPYQPHSENERYVMIFSFSTDKPHNATATALFRDAVKPTQINTPYQSWMCANTVISYKTAVVTEVRGPVMIVKERKIDGRWQLALKNLGTSSEHTLLLENSVSQ